MNRRNIGPSSWRSAFTLVELMVSIVLVLLLLLGINTIFKMSSDTVGLGNAVNAIARSHRSIESIIVGDAAAIPKDAPLFVIHCMPASREGNFLNEADRARDLDNDPATADLDGDVTTNEQFSPITDINDRRHRADLMAYPLRGLQRRRTANVGEFSSTVRTYEAWAWLGHLWHPDMPRQLTFSPGPATDPLLTGESPSIRPPQPTGPQSLRYAQNWTTGRVTILLRDSLLMAGDPPQQQQRHYPRVHPTSDSQPPDFSPIGYGTMAEGDSGGNVKPSAPFRIANKPEYVDEAIQGSRYDLAGASLAELRSYVSELKNWVRNNNSNAAHDLDALRNGRPVWQDLIYRFEYRQSMIRDVANSGIEGLSHEMAKVAPIMAENISQMIIEYAGDFLTQHNRLDAEGNADSEYGLVKDLKPDGITDFYVENKGTPEEVRKIRWYGMPRDIDGDGRIVARPSMNNNQLVDVIPLRDIARTIPLSSEAADPPDNVSNWQSFEGANFERQLPRHRSDYRTIPAADEPFFRYTCIWTGEAPRMVRILMKAEDPNGRLRDGQWWEFVMQP